MKLQNWWFLGLSEEILVYKLENMWTYEIKLTIGP